MPTTLPSGLTARPAAAADVPGLLDMLRRYEQALTGATVLAVEDLSAPLESEQARASTAVVVVLAEDRPVARYSVHRDAPGRWFADVIVDDDLDERTRRELIESGVLGVERTVAAHSGADGAERITHTCWPQDAGYTAVLSRLGYEAVRAFSELRIDLAGRTRHSPDSRIAIRRADLSRADGADARAVYEVISGSFRDHWDHHERDFDDWIAYRTSKPHFQRDEWYIAELEGRLAGATIHHDGYVPDQRAAHIDSLGTLRWARGRGVARALLEHSFTRAEQRGLDAVTLYVDTQSPTRADALYESVGMRPVRTGEEWQKYVTPSADPTTTEPRATTAQPRDDAEPPGRRWTLG